MPKIIFDVHETKEAICLLAQKKHGLNITPDQLVEETAHTGEYDDQCVTQVGWSVELIRLGGG